MKSLTVMIACGVCFAAVAHVELPSDKRAVEGSCVEDSMLNRVPCVNKEIENDVKQLSQGKFGSLYKDDYKFDKVVYLSKWN